MAQPPLSHINTKRWKGGIKKRVGRAMIPLTNSSGMTDMRRKVAGFIGGVFFSLHILVCMRNGIKLSLY